MAKKRERTDWEIADRVKAERPCMKCRKMLWTTRCKRLCKKCGGVADNTPPHARPHRVALANFQEAGYA